MSNHTPDPTPAFLPPAHLAEIRERADAPLRPMPDAEKRAEYFGQAVSDRAALLAHLDALTPRAPVDGEALGREARASHMDWSEDTASVWPFLTEKVRGDYCRTAIHVHAIGHAAGRSEGEAERAEQSATIARLTTELAEARDTLRMASVEIPSIIDDRDAEIARLEKVVETARFDETQKERNRLIGLVRGLDLSRTTEGVLDALRADDRARAVKDPSQ